MPMIQYTSLTLSKKIALELNFLRHTHFINQLPFELVIVMLSTEHDKHAYLDRYITPIQKTISVLLIQLKSYNHLIIYAIH